MIAGAARTSFLKFDLSELELDKYVSRGRIKLR